MIELTPVQRRALRASAHTLHPVVSVSQKGLTDSVLKEIDRCLTTHELIKIRVYDSERDQREAYLSEICTKLTAAPIQHIGHLLVVWREKPVAAGAETPAPRRRAAPRLTKKAAVAKTDKAARARKIVQGKPRRPTRT
jgi:RNA-binding protein